MAFGGKMNYATFVKALVPKGSSRAKFFNQRDAEAEKVIRKIDFLHPSLDLALAEFVVRMVQLALEKESYTKNIVKCRDFQMLLAYKMISVD
jgi:hypothetical protein